ncbi:MAG: MBL fold metallo-hydrolase, partial [Sphingobacteriales bacterium]
MLARARQLLDRAVTLERIADTIGNRKRAAFVDMRIKMHAVGSDHDRKIIHPVGEGPRALGVAPDKVDHVIATHMHWDHAGNYDLFPNARYHIQDTEMAYA